MHHKVYVDRKPKSALFKYESKNKMSSSSFQRNTVAPRGFAHFYILTSYSEIDKTTWTYSSLRKSRGSRGPFRIQDLQGPLRNGLPRFQSMGYHGTS